MASFFYHPDSHTGQRKTKAIGTIKKAHSQRITGRTTQAQTQARVTLALARPTCTLAFIIFGKPALYTQSSRGVRSPRDAVVQVESKWPAC